MTDPMLWKTLYSDFQMTPHCVVQYPHPSDRQTTAASHSVDLEIIGVWSEKENTSFNPEKSHNVTRSLQNGRQRDPPLYFLGHPLKEVNSLELINLTNSHGLS